MYKLCRVLLIINKKNEHAKCEINITYIMLLLKWHEKEHEFYKIDNLNLEQKNWCIFFLLILGAPQMIILSGFSKMSFCASREDIF